MKLLDILPWLGAAPVRDIDSGAATELSGELQIELSDSEREREL